MCRPESEMLPEFKNVRLIVNKWWVNHRDDRDTVELYIVRYHTLQSLSEEDLQIHKKVTKSEYLNYYGEWIEYPENTTIQPFSEISGMSVYTDEYKNIVEKYIERMLEAGILPEERDTNV